ncbi:hypothetical protein PX554_11860 [Sphingomonas sp. H39-1-10]|uniref:hypothetical protein n=1 Tax=Sphingomonas pollutisoli TaxID=3030829 RepID=UPI0023B90D75|nr:hypothetical protein [Sphingomonas pollutisoli]MDF0488827.1 hypothetical protein [Sphingomonas pollutisoli]
MSDDTGVLTMDGMAEAVAAMRDEDDKGRAVLAMVRSAIASGSSERDVFLAVYGDETGKEYWASFLRRAMTEGELIRALATHLASPSRLRRQDGEIVAMANLPTPRVTRAIEALPSNLRLSETSAYPTEIVEALAAKSSPALPVSLLEYLRPSASECQSGTRKSPGPQPLKREALKASMRRWAIENGVDAFGSLKLEFAVSEFGASKTLTQRALKEVRAEFAVLGS